LPKNSAIKASCFEKKLSFRLFFGLFICLSLVFQSYFSNAKTQAFTNFIAKYAGIRNKDVHLKGDMLYE